jgi:hypothetical protein
MATTKTNKLSAYTIAKNCADLSDVNAGINELKEYFTACEKVGKNPTATACIRFAKLGIKRDKLTRKRK